MTTHMAIIIHLTTTSRSRNSPTVALEAPVAINEKVWPIIRK